MLFPLRAALVIGGLSYLAILKDRPDDAPVLPAAPMRALSTQTFPAQTLAVAWEAMPADVRERIAREGADVFAQSLAPRHAPSADTLAEADRRLPWRGAAR